MKTKGTKMQTSVTKKTVSMALSVLISCAAVGTAQAVTIRGTPSCGNFIKHKADDKWPAFADTNWLNGYLSGMAVYSNKDILKGTDNESISLWVDNYCRANPLKNLGDAGATLFDELEQQKKL